MMVEQMTPKPVNISRNSFDRLLLSSSVIDVLQNGASSEVSLVNNSVNQVGSYLGPNFALVQRKN